MAKMKSHKGARKRFKITGSGKVKRMRAFKSHILTKEIVEEKASPASGNDHHDSGRDEEHQAPPPSLEE